MSLSRFRIRIIPLVLIAAYPIAGCSVSDPSLLSTKDEQKIRALEQAYVDAWVRGDSAAVLATLSPDVVLMPGGGLPIVGLDAARGYWWPDDGSRTTITAYTSTIFEIRGSASLAYVRGASALDFVYERDSVRVEQSSRSMSLAIVRKGAGNEWRITHRMWAPLSQ
jgi:ketosteroid isomerase-like protein